MENIFWTGYSNDERHAAISSIQQVISKYGDIVDFKLFSDISISIKIEMEECCIDRLYDELSQNIGIDGFKYLGSSSKRERTVFLAITFGKGTGDLIIETPSVPG